MRVVTGWLFMFLGGIPFVLLAASWIDSLADGNVVVYPKLLVVGGVIFCVGFAIREWGYKARRRKDLEVK